MPLQPPRLTLLAAALFLAALAPCLGATITVEINPVKITADQTATLTVVIENGEVANVDLPQVDGLLIQPGPSSVTYAFTGGTLLSTSTRKYQLMPARAGDFAIPPFDVTLKDGSTLRSQEVTLHVDSAASATDSAPARRGPIVLPAANGGDASTSSTNAAPAIAFPRGSDGQIAKVFMLIRTQTTDAYVGQMVPLRIDFFIRQDANADQDSLPTIKGSDFLMNDFAVRGHASMISLENRAYECDTFLSAFAAPKSGDFPLASERDTYWVQSISASSLDPLGFTHNANLAHGMITSNQLVMHIRPLPDEGRPADFSGAVGQFQVTSDAQPAVVPMGDPVILTFGISGVGNFDYVHCPALTTDPNWKVYAPKSSIAYNDEERTQGAKTFEQSVIPRENGNVPLPQASFSYFDPFRRQYITVPINLPAIAVTGAMPLATAPSATPPTSGDLVPPPDTANDFAPNRMELGELRPSLTPVYRAAWFWPVQAACAALPFLGLLIFFLRRRQTAGLEDAETLARRRSLRQEESAMEQALRMEDARAFFLSARHALQLHLRAAWKVAPESITLGEIRRRDPDRAQVLAPFFLQADEIFYSGNAPSRLDLSHWARVARECLHPQTAPS